MKKRIWKQASAAVLSLSILTGGANLTNAAKPKDGMTEASTTADAGTNGYDKWKKSWEDIRDDWTQISLTPGSDASQLNFAWYSLADDSGIPRLKIGKGRKMEDAEEYTAVQSDATVDTKNNVSYKTNKVTAVGLEENTTYYYRYQINGEWSAPKKYKTHSIGNFSFIFVGDPQIGSSNSQKGEDTPEFYEAQSDSVANDTFNWNVTLNRAMEKTDNTASFVVSAGDQIQTTKKKAPGKAAWVSEIEYAGYLSPDLLKSLPVATTVGNHDADNPNYTYHFNTPNNSEKGSNGIVGGDYWFAYGNVLFLILNTQDTNVAEHKLFIEEAVAANQNCKWRIAVLHQDIYGSAEHSNEPEITNLRYTLVPYFEENDVDVVLTGHDHAYSRSYLLKGGAKTVSYTDDEFDEMLEKDIETDTDAAVFVANGNIGQDTKDPAEQQYLQYLNAVMDSGAVASENTDTVENPEGILYMTANSSSGSKYYDLTARRQNYIANRWQEDVPTYSVIDMTENSFTINTYRTDTDEKIDTTFTIKKGTAKAEQPPADEKISLEQAQVTGIENKVYTGKDITQTITVKEPKGSFLKEGIDYQLSYKDNKNAGVASLIITGIENYEGSKTVTFQIQPPRVSLKKLSAEGAKKVRVKFSAVKGNPTGYQITYANKSSFKAAKKVITKKTDCILKKLKKGKTYFVKIRAYKQVGKEKIYGRYSAKKKITVKP